MILARPKNLCIMQFDCSPSKTHGVYLLEGSSLLSALRMLPGIKAALVAKARVPRKLIQEDRTSKILAKRRKSS